VLMFRCLALKPLTCAGQPAATVHLGATAKQRLPPAVLASRAGHGELRASIAGAVACAARGRGRQRRRKSEQDAPRKWQELHPRSQARSNTARTPERSERPAHRVAQESGAEGRRPEAREPEEAPVEIVEQAEGRRPEAREPKAAPVEIVELASSVVRGFVEGPGSYPVVRRLASFRRAPGEEVLTPEGGQAHPHLTPRNWAACDLDRSAAHRLFYKMALGGHCSELCYLYLEVLNALAAERLPVFEGRRVRGAWLCVGFVTHDYRKLTLEADFGQNYWQHSTGLHCGARNHFWIEFPLPGTDPNDWTEHVILDLSAIQFDMPGLRENAYVHVTRAPDERYRKCYAIPSTSIPIHFINWGEFRPLSARDTIDRAASLIAELGATPRRFSLSTAWTWHTAGQELSPLEFNCQLTLDQVKKMETAAACEMARTLGEGNPYAAGCAIL